MSYRKKRHTSKPEPLERHSGDPVLSVHHIEIAVPEADHNGGQQTGVAVIPRTGCWRILTAL